LEQAKVKFPKFMPSFRTYSAAKKAAEDLERNNYRAVLSASSRCPTSLRKARQAPAAAQSLIEL
jgi:hypothetical protein